jgi:hypothetical protein
MSFVVKSEVDLRHRQGWAGDIDLPHRKLVKIINHLSSNRAHVILLGDFNFPDIDWNSHTSTTLNNCFLDCISSLGMIQFVSDPTRFSNSTASNTLDLIFSNEPLSVQITNHLPPLSTSDHSIIEFLIFPPSIKHHPLSNSSPQINSDANSQYLISLPKYNWSAADFPAIIDHLSNIDWHSLFGFYFDVNTIWSQFKSIIWPIIDLYVPKISVSHFTKYHPRHYPKHIRILLNRKAATWRSFKLYKTTELKTKYAHIALETKKAIIDFDTKNEEKMLKTKNLGSFYRFVNGKLNNNDTGIAPLFDTNGNLLISDLDKANLLNDYFSSVFTNDNGLLPDFPSRFPPNVHATLDDISITPEIINKILCNLKSNSAAGPDLIPSIFFKKTSSIISYPLATMYRIFIDLHDIPSDWKTATITPKFKKGQPSLPSNYRPIALTCTCCKILEKIIANELILFLKNHNLIDKQQHGFLKHHSTATNLLDSLNDWTISLSAHHSTTIAYIDFQRAFDSVSHEKLLHKLASYGISGNLLLWIKNFLTNRSQTVRIGVAHSSPCKVSSGIPQGSVLGPILFILFVNDIADPFGPTVKSKLFADDIKIYSTISDLSSAINFQYHLDLIHLWSITWQLPIAQSKCSLFQIGSNFNPSSNFPFKLNNTQMAQIKTVRDLGILVDDNLKFISHINEILKRSNQRANLIHRTFLSRNQSSLTTAYKVFVRPLLEYNSIIWSPSQIGLINNIESVQRSFTKRFPGLNNLSYADRLLYLNLQSLEHRRLIYDLVTCYNIVYNRIANAFDDFFNFSHNPSSRGHHLRLSLPLVKTNTHKFFFSSRVIKPWNSLPSHIVSSDNVKIFKFRLHNHDLSQFLIFPSVYA